MRCPNCGFPYPSVGLCSFCRPKNQVLYHKTGNAVDAHSCTIHQIDRALAQADNKFDYFDPFKKKKEPWEF